MKEKGDKMKTRVISISAAALTFLAVAGNINRSRAETLDMWVDPTTWAFDHVNCPVPGDCHDDPEDGAWTNVVSHIVTANDSFGEPET